MFEPRGIIEPSFSVSLVAVFTLPACTSRAVLLRGGTLLGAPVAQTPAFIR